MSKPWVTDKLRQLVPKHISAEKMARVMLLTISRDAKLQACSPASLLRALMRCGQIGLEPDGILVHLIPYKTEVQVIIDWKGLVEIARRNGVVAKPVIVRERDEFEYLEDDGTGRTSVKHAINPRSDRGKIIGAYSRAKTIETGELDYEWMSVEEIEATRARSAASNSGPWVSDYSEMCRKTPLRRHAKRWPLKFEDRKALEGDDDKPTDIKTTVHTDPIPEPDIITEPVEQTPPEDLPTPPADEPDFPPEQEPQTEPASPEPPPVKKQRAVELTKLQEELWSFVEANKGTYDILQEIMVDLRIDGADKWTGIYEVPDAACRKLLTAKRTVAVRMRHLASTAGGTTAPNASGVDSTMDLPSEPSSPA